MPSLGCQFSSTGLVWQKIQEPLTQDANLFGVVRVKIIGNKGKKLSYLLSLVPYKCHACRSCDFLLYKICAGSICNLFTFTITSVFQMIYRNIWFRNSEKQEDLPAYHQLSQIMWASQCSQRTANTLNAIQLQWIVNFSNLKSLLLPHNPEGVGVYCFRGLLNALTVKQTGIEWLVGTMWSNRSR